MGVDVALLPFGTSSDNPVKYSHDILQLERRRELWEPLQEIEDRYGREVPEYFNSYLSREGDCEESHYGRTLQTPYGTKLKYVAAEHLKPLKDHPGVQDNWLNRAVWAYIEQMPDNWQVAIFWH